MLSDKIKSEKLGQVKETFYVTRRMLGLVWKYEPKLFVGSAISNIIPGVIPFINAYIYKLIIDWVIGATQFPNPNFSQLATLMGLRLSTFFLQSAAFSTQEYIERILWTKFPIHLNHLIYQKISSLDMYYLENSEFKDLLEKVRDSVNYRPQRIVGNSFYVFQELVAVILSLIAIAALNGFLIILVAAVAIPEFIIQTRYAKIAWGVWGGNASFRKRFYYLTHLLQGERYLKEIKIFTLAANFLKEIKSVQEKFYKENKELISKNFLQRLTFRGLSTIVFIGVELFVIIEVLAKRLTVGDIGFYTSVVNNFQNGLSGLFRTMGDIFDSSLYVKSLFEVLDTEPVIKVAENPVKLQLKSPPTIEFKDVDFAYPGVHRKILKGFSLTIKPGEKIAFVGENGAGKSTIIKLLARFYDVTAGEILINGINIKELDLQSWYKYFGVLFQDYNKYDDKVRENISFGKVHEDASLEEIIKASISAGSHEMIKKFDKGYDQMLGKTFEGGIEPSGGQWQKIALARAFFRNAPVVVLDEPTAAIDAKAEAEIFSRVEKLSRDKSVIIISHRFSTVRNADKIYVIDKGKIVESGSHESLMKLNGQYSTLFNLQAKGYQ